MPTWSSIPSIPSLYDSLVPYLTPPLLSSLSEVGIYPSPGQSDDHPSFLIENNALGIASHALTPLYAECRRRLQRSSSDLIAASVLLLACPDFTTAWNIRKRYFTNVDEELHFNKLMLLRQPKSAEAWTHRWWILKTHGYGRSGPSDEQELCWKLSERVKSNYWIGVHRLRVGVKGGACSLLERSREWIGRHPGDSSGWWWHRYLLNQCHENPATTEENQFAHSLKDRYGDKYQCINIHVEWLKHRET